MSPAHQRSYLYPSAPSRRITRHVRAPLHSVPGDPADRRLPLPVAGDKVVERPSSDPFHLGRRIDVSVCRDMEQNLPLARPLGQRGRAWTSGVPFPESRCPGTDSPPRTGGAGVRANARMSDKPVGSADAANLLGEPNSVEHAANPERPMAHTSGLLIYLRHFGALNVDEFRRTNTRGL